MLKIAICDDEPIVVEQIREYLEEIKKKQNIQLEIVEFYSGKKLVEASLERGAFDIIYLDIEMQSMNGINTALKIRENDVSVLLIYVSSYEGYFKQLFEVEPFRFIKKPINQKVFVDIFLKASQRISQNINCFHFQYNKSIIKIPLKDIMYFDSQRRLVNVHTEQNVYAYYDKLDSVEKQIKNDNIVFLRVHKSYLVNYQYIKQWEFSQITLFNGYIIRISEEKRKIIRNKYMELLGGTRDD